MCTLERLHVLLGFAAQQNALLANTPRAMLVAIDCEAFEMDQSKVTEVGISTIDTTSVRALQPQSYGQSYPLIASSHYRIKEHGHLRNRRYSKGNPKNFQHGKTAWVSIEEAREVLRAMLEDAEGTREVVLVGHALQNDLAYLRRLGIDALAIPNVVLQLDTQRIATPKKLSPGLGKLLTALGIPADNLHNAGNDAHFTLRAVLEIARKEFNNPGSVLESLPNPQGHGKRAQDSRKTPVRSATANDDHQTQMVDQVRAAQLEDTRLPTS
ncbi:hypothetical protein CKM354_000301600 [Cercospora kikuchii]|uniref:Gfd2/YDR514C-like C-terminal domain-containing protein n=1 Tax=Cercospora kikuchii TaxID=84275 RepID=A0A9P3CBD1_9PEZI|nr:uncharacterized protein CKM354_000301600 [Cercospora kikuchii]GIZ39641.1 hypothetical protein CKM354_000301600 [Cercospora kikuchii]